MNIVTSLYFPPTPPSWSSSTLKSYHPSSRQRGLARVIMTSSVLVVIIAVTLFGNGLVITAVVRERGLRSFAANYLIASLAVADLLVALLVMPFALVNEVMPRWMLGPELCDLWTSVDVLCCTASIFHLVAISVDRYLAVTRVDYIHRRSTRRILLVVALSWALSFVISIPPLLGWRSPPTLDPFTVDNPRSLGGYSVEGEELILPAPPSQFPTNSGYEKVDKDEFSLGYGVKFEQQGAAYSSEMGEEKDDDSDGSSVGFDVWVNSFGNQVNEEDLKKRWEQERDWKWRQGMGGEGGGGEGSGEGGEWRVSGVGRVRDVGQCLISQDKGYTVFSTFGAFYLPLIFMIPIYYKIYKEARSRIHRKQFQRRTSTTDDDILLRRVSCRTMTLSHDIALTSRHDNVRSASRHDGTLTSRLGRVSACSRGSCHVGGLREGIGRFRPSTLAMTPIRRTIRPLYYQQEGKGGGGGGAETEEEGGGAGGGEWVEGGSEGGGEAGGKEVGVRGIFDGGGEIRKSAAAPTRVWKGGEGRGWVDLSISSSPSTTLTGSLSGGCLYMSRDVYGRGGGGIDGRGGGGEDGRDGGGEESVMELDSLNIDSLNVDSVAEEYCTSIDILHIDSDESEHSALNGRVQQGCQEVPGDGCNSGEVADADDSVGVCGRAIGCGAVVNGGVYVDVVVDVSGCIAGDAADEVGGSVRDHKGDKGREATDANGAAGCTGGNIPGGEFCTANSDCDGVASNSYFDDSHCPSDGDVVGSNMSIRGGCDLTESVNHGDVSDHGGRLVVDAQNSDDSNDDCNSNRRDTVSDQSDVACDVACDVANDVTCDAISSDDGDDRSLISANCINDINVMRFGYHDGEAEELVKAGILSQSPGNSSESFKGERLSVSEIRMSGIHNLLASELFVNVASEANDTVFPQITSDDLGPIPPQLGSEDNLGHLPVAPVNSRVISEDCFSVTPQPVSDTSLTHHTVTPQAAVCNVTVESVEDQLTLSDKDQLIHGLTDRLRQFTGSFRQRLQRRGGSGGQDHAILSPNLTAVVTRRHAKQKEKMERKRERKAARTLAIVTGSFVVCWLPFFVVATLRPFCTQSCSFPADLLSVVLWLGYFNSLINPIIYTVFNRDFRAAFARLLHAHRPRRRRSPTFLPPNQRLPPSGDQTPNQPLPRCCFPSSANQRDCHPDVRSRHEVIPVRSVIRKSDVAAVREKYTK